MLTDARAVHTPGISERTTSSPASKWYHTDALGSTRGITNSSQTVTDTVLYDAFGMTVSRTGSTATPFGFVGAQQYQSDPDSGLQLLGHRMYDPSIGRFISSDPAKAGTNWFCYCLDSPLLATDAKGLDWVDRTSDFVAGWGDGLTLGGAGWIRRNWIEKPLGLDNSVNQGSGDYKTGKTVWQIHAVTLVVAVLVSAIQKLAETPAVPRTWPEPPGFSDDWTWRYGESRRYESPRWFDPNGGEWRYHEPDPWHEVPHWDYNPWDA